METNITESSFVEKRSKEESFVDYILNKCKNDKGCCASLRQIINPNMESYSYEYLINWCDIEKPWEFKPYALIAASIARTKQTSKNNKGIGICFLESYSGLSKDASQAKLRRLLACRNVEEACEILNQLLRFIEGKNIPINHTKLLRELVFFSEHSLKTWAKEFYRKDV